MDPLQRIPVGQPIVCQQGKTLTLSGESGPVWHITEGIFKLMRQTRDGPMFVQLARAGDLIGVEVLCANPYTFSAIALVDSQAEPLCSEHAREQIETLTQGFIQQQRQSLDMMRLRSGAVVQRLSYLLHLLAQHEHMPPDQLNRKRLPSLREMAQIVDSVRETVCRELHTLLPSKPSTQTQLGAPRISASVAFV